MPNWCSNTLELTHSDPTMIERAKDSFAEGSFLNEFIPMPKELRGTRSPSREEDAEANVVLKAKYGYDNWYDWATDNWGVKWDVGRDGHAFYSAEHSNNLILNFDSPWSPPLRGVEALREQGFTCRLYYWESGMCFAGVSAEGQDKFYNLANLNSEQIKTTLPTELNQAFGISDWISQMEKEQ